MELIQNIGTINYVCTFLYAASPIGFMCSFNTRYWIQCSTCERFHHTELWADLEKILTVLHRIQLAWEMFTAYFEGYAYMCVCVCPWENCLKYLLMMTWFWIDSEWWTRQVIFCEEYWLSASLQGMYTKKILTPIFICMFLLYKTLQVVFIMYCCTFCQSLTHAYKFHVWMTQH